MPSPRWHENNHWLWRMPSSRGFWICCHLWLFCALIWNILKGVYRCVYHVFLAYHTVKYFSCREYAKLSAQWPLTQTWPRVACQTVSDWKGLKYMYMHNDIHTLPQIIPEIKSRVSFCKDFNPGILITTWATQSPVISTLVGSVSCY